MQKLGCFAANVLLRMRQLYKDRADVQQLIGSVEVWCGVRDGSSSKNRR